MKQEAIYRPEEDSYFSEPYIDVEEWREKPIRHFFVHGGFHGTEKNGTEVRFCIYFPEKEKYEGRFFQYLSPAPEDEHESENLKGDEDKISFFISHGAYYLVSNQGGLIFDDPCRLYQSNANCAVYSRKAAQKFYGYEHRPYGYCFGGSGGSFKTMSCMEMTEGVWDGAVPYVLANPMAAPNVFSPRVRVMRLLGEKGMQKLVDAMEPGGSGDLYEGLDEYQKEALLEASKMGFPKRAWFNYTTMGDGGLMVLIPYIYGIYPQYFQDFWTKPGFAGADLNSSESRDRVQFVTEVKELVFQKKSGKKEEFNSVDNSWMNVLVGDNVTPKVRIEKIPPKDAYMYHCRLRVLDGEAKGKEVTIDSIEGDLIKASVVYNGTNQGNVLEGLKAGDHIMIDNSDSLAIQTFHRHQIPDETYRVYDQFRNSDGSLKYPQLPMLIAPVIAKGGGGSVPDGNIHGKVIVVCSLLDESAFPWHGDWYRERVKEKFGEKEKDIFRIYYNDNCIHDDRDRSETDPWHTVSYVGILQQAFLDVAAWCEKGIEPAPNTKYQVIDGQVEVAENAQERGGLQPVVHAYANGKKCVRIHVGEEVQFLAEIEVPAHTGTVTYAGWDYEQTKKFERVENMLEHAEKVSVHTSHVFQKKGTYLPTVKVSSSRTGKEEDIFVQCKNLDRVRVIVE